MSKELKDTYTTYQSNSLEEAIEEVTEKVIGYQGSNSFELLHINVIRERNMTVYTDSISYTFKITEYKG